LKDMWWRGHEEVRCIFMKKSWRSKDCPSVLATKELGREMEKRIGLSGEGPVFRAEAKKVNQTQSGRGAMVGHGVLHHVEFLLQEGGCKLLAEKESLRGKRVQDRGRRSFREGRKKTMREKRLTAQELRKREKSL